MPMRKGRSKGLTLMPVEGEEGKLNSGRRFPAPLRGALPEARDIPVVLPPATVRIPSGEGERF